MGEKFDSLVADETKRQIIAAILLGLVMVAGAAFEGIPWTMRIVLGLVTVVAILWLQDRYRAQINRFVEALGYSVDPRATTPQDMQSILSRKEQHQRHYSPESRDKIDAMFLELKDFLNKEVTPLWKEGNDLWSKWNSQLDPLPLKESIDEVKRFAEKADTLDKRLYEGIYREYKSYETLFEEVLAAQNARPIAQSKEFAHHLVQHLTSASKVYESLSGKPDDLQELIKLAVNRFTATTTALNQWTADSLRRIEEQEREILGR